MISVVFRYRISAAAAIVATSIAVLTGCSSAAAKPAHTSKPLVTPAIVATAGVPKSILDDHGTSGSMTISDPHASSTEGGDMELAVDVTLHNASSVPFDYDLSTTLGAWDGTLTDYDAGDIPQIPIGIESSGLPEIGPLAPGATVSGQVTFLDDSGVDESTYTLRMLTPKTFKPVAVWFLRTSNH